MTQDTAVTLKLTKHEAEKLTACLRLGYTLQRWTSDICCASVNGGTDGSTFRWLGFISSVIDEIHKQAGTTREDEDYECAVPSAVNAIAGDVNKLVKQIEEEVQNYLEENSK